MRKYSCPLALLAAIFALAVAAYTTHAQSPTLKIGFSIEAMNGERWQTDLDAFQTRAKQLGAEVISADAKGNDDLQFQQVQDMIKAGIKTLVLLPHDATKAGRMVEAAKAAHVKVISYDRLVQNSDVDLYITFDRVAIGTMQAEYLVAHAPKGNYVLIGGSPTDEGAIALHDAQMKVLKPYIDRGDIHLAGDNYIKDWLPSEAYLFTLKTIDSSHARTSPPSSRPTTAWPEARSRPSPNTNSPAKSSSPDRTPISRPSSPSPRARSR